MRGAVLYGPRDVRFEERPEPKIVHPTDAILKLSATSVCGSDLWPYRGIDGPAQPTPMGHEYCGEIEEVGSAVRRIKPGQFVVGSFFASDNSCAICRAGYQSRCTQLEYVGAGGAQAPRLRVPLADGTLVPTPGALRSHTPARSSRRGLPGHGRTKGNQGTAGSVRVQRVISIMK